MGKKQIIISQYENEIYEGVTRSDNGRVSHGDRHDAAFAEMRERIQNRPAYSDDRPSFRDFRKEQELREWPEVREKLISWHGERVANEYFDEHFNGGKEAKRKADELFRVRVDQAERFQAQSARSDLHGTPTRGYVPPNEKPINGYAVLALVVCLSVLLVKTITGG